MDRLCQIRQQGLQLTWPQQTATSAHVRFHSKPNAPLFLSNGPENIGSVMGANTLMPSQNPGLHLLVPGCMSAVLRQLQHRAVDWCPFDKGTLKTGIVCAVHLSETFLKFSLLEEGDSLWVLQMLLRYSKEILKILESQLVIEAIFKQKSPRSRSAPLNSFCAFWDHVAV